MDADKTISIEKETRSEKVISSSKSKTDCAAEIKLAFCVDDLMKKVDRMLTKLETIDKLEEKIAQDERKTN